MSIDEKYPTAWDYTELEGSYLTPFTTKGIVIIFGLCFIICMMLLNFYPVSSDVFIGCAGCP